MQVRRARGECIGCFGRESCNGLGERIQVLHGDRAGTAAVRAVAVSTMATGIMALGIGRSEVVRVI